MAATFLSLALLLGVARTLGEIARRFQQPAVLGELLAGILLGPTVFGAALPDAWQSTFGTSRALIDAIVVLAIVFFLLVAGLEVNLPGALRRGRAAMLVGLVGMIGPFAVAFTVARWAPGVLGVEPPQDPFAFALFFGVAMSISALPVIAKILLDLGLLRTDFASVVIAAAVVQDVTGWMLFAVVLGMIGRNSGGPPLAVTAALVLAFMAFMLTVFRWTVHRILPWLLARTSWPGGVIGFIVTLALSGAAFSEWLGVHAIFGSFLVGVAFGDSAHLRQRTRATLDDFVSFAFAPIFFASVGLSVDFGAHFHLPTVLAVLGIAITTKIAFGVLGGRWGGLRTREALGVGFAMNARGAMEIILGLLALDAGLIGEQLFVALVVTALTTSLIAGPLVVRALETKRPRRFTDHLRADTLLRPIVAVTKWEAIRELARVGAVASGIDLTRLERALADREKSMPTGLGNELAMPHARIADLRSPVVCLGLSDTGIDFDAADGRPARIIVGIFTPEQDVGGHLELLADVARALHTPEVRASVLRAETLDQLLAAVRAPDARG